MSNFLDKLIDWKEFELFIKSLYAEDPSMTVKHNVTMVGKSGAKRQIDVLISHKSKLHTYVTVVECKRWKEKIDRSIIDILYATIEDINASKGVVFTTSGYEGGAQKYAESKNIDIFLVRELTPEEWGLPGRVVNFYMHVIAGNLKQPSMKATLIPIVEKYPPRINIEIVIEKDKPLDENLNLFSIVDGRKGANLIDLLMQKQSELLHMICGNLPIIEEGKDGASLVIMSEVELIANDYEYRQLRLQYGVVNIEKLLFSFIIRVSQSHFHFDRGEGLDMALVVENYIRKQIHVVSRKADDDLTVSANIYDTLVDKCIAKGDVLENNSILKAYLDPTVSIDLKGNEIIATTGKVVLRL